mmetsp:Transcript_27788/g.24388  ORF Transcript_27788/g.24388 Transcript_27788/m.24388 type:complete len:243 (-) Transcript_27788:1073-1801(-)
MMLFNDGLHGGVKKDFLNGSGIGQKHGQSIYTHTPTSSGRKTVFEGLNEAFIDLHGFIITLSLLLGLVNESLSLVEGIVQLSESVTNFVMVNEELESFSEAWVFSVQLSKRRNQDGMVNDESGVQAVNFNEVADELVNQSSSGDGSRAFNLVLNGLLLEELEGFFGFDILGDFLTKLLTESLQHGDSLEGRGEIDDDGVLIVSFGMELKLVVTSEGLDQTRKEVFGELHQIVVISISHIEFN